MVGLQVAIAEMLVDMEDFWALVLIFLLAYSAASFIFTKHPKHKLPPGPKPWPVIGNLNLIGSIPHQSLHLLSKRYGEIMLLRFGKFPVIVASTPEMAKQFLKTHDSVCASRPALEFGTYISYGSLDMGWAPYGPYWRQLRKLCLSEIFRAKMAQSKMFDQIRADERRNLFSHLHSLSGKPVFLRGHLFRYMLSTISKMVMSKNYYHEAGDENSSVVELKEFEAMLDEAFFLYGAFNIGDWIPWLRFLDLQGYAKRMKALHKKLDRVFDFVIDDHEARRKGEKNFDSGKDFVDKLLELAQDSNAEIQFTRNCVKALIQNLILGSKDTVSTTVEWTIREVMKQPRLIEKAKEELDRVIGRKRWVEEDDCSQLPYIDAIIKESMRLHPIATFLGPHYTLGDFNVAGYHVPKGTMVLINTWSIGRDPNSWDAPEEFFPERFMGKDIDILGSDFTLLPFGSGRRRCPGYDLGLKSVRAIIANLLHGFNLKLVDGMRAEDIGMEEKYGLTTHPKEDLAIVMEPALPPHLY